MGRIAIARPNEFWVLTKYPSFCTAYREAKPGVRPEYRMYNSLEALEQDFPNPQWEEAP